MLDAWGDRHSYPCCDGFDEVEASDQRQTDPVDDEKHAGKISSQPEQMSRLRNVRETTHTNTPSLMRVWVRLGATLATSAWIAQVRLYVSMSTMISASIAEARAPIFLAEHCESMCMSSDNGKNELNNGAVIKKGVLAAVP